MIKVHWKTCSLKKWNGQFDRVLQTVALRILKLIWKIIWLKQNVSVFHPKWCWRHGDSQSELVQEERPTIKSIEITLPQRWSWVFKKLLLKLVAQDLDPSHWQSYMFIHEIVRPLKPSSHRRIRHIRIFWPFIMQTVPWPSSFDNAVSTTSSKRPLADRYRLL